MKNLTLKNIALACGGVYHGNPEDMDKEVLSITSDSRKAEPGCLFAAIPGERVDGHRFIPDVMAKGALCALGEREPGDAAYPYIRVDSTLQALKDIAEFYLEQLGIPVIGITGSVGKTSTKETIASVLKEKYNVLKTQGNFNNELGLPLTVFRLREEHEIAVLEMGISSFGEMTRLAKVAKPETCVITNIGTCHLEFLGDRDGVLRAKTEIFAYVKPDGHIVLNGDDDKLSAVKGYNGIRPVFFGMDPKLPVYADELESHGFQGTSCRIHMGGESFRVLVPVPGRHMVYNALAAAAVGQIYGLSPEQIRRGIGNLETIAGRFKIIETGKFLVVDDSYNASPASMKASLEILQDGRGRRVAVLGDMGELGSAEEELHRQVGEFAGRCGIDMCICAGPLARHIAEGAKAANPDLQVIHEPDRETLLRKLPGYVREGDTILVKASHFMKFDEVAEFLEEM